MREELIPIFHVRDASGTAEWYAGFTIEGEHRFAPSLPQVPSDEAAPFRLKRKIVMHHTHR